MPTATEEKALAMFGGESVMRTPAGPPEGCDCDPTEPGLGLCTKTRVLKNSLQFLKYSRADEGYVLARISAGAAADAALGLAAGDIVLDGDQEQELFTASADATTAQGNRWWMLTTGEISQDNRGNLDTSSLCYLVWGLAVNPTDVWQSTIATPTQATAALMLTNFLSMDAAQRRELQAMAMRDLLLTARVGPNRTEGLFGLACENPGSGGTNVEGEARNTGDALTLQYTALCACFVIAGSPLVNSDDALTLLLTTLQVTKSIEADAANPANPERGDIRVGVRVQLIGAIICCPSASLCKPAAASASAGAPGRA